MRPRTSSLGFLLPVGFICGLFLAVEAAAGQDSEAMPDRPQYGFGFVANAPDLMAGAGGYVILPVLGGIGLYLDAKFDPTNPSGKSGFEKDLISGQVQGSVPGNSFIMDEASWQSFNVSVVRPLTPFLMMYAGGGVTKRILYELYEEPSLTRGIGGVFWVEAPAREETRVNLMVGAFLRLGPWVSTQFGFETQPRGMSVGVSARLPRW
jgi:hypothetical protein